MKKREKEQKVMTPKEELFDLIRWIAGCVIVAVLLRTFVIASVVVPTGSMENTIMAGDRLLGLKCAYTFHEVQRQDVIMFYEPLDPKVLYLKRVIGLPGETVTIRNGEVFVSSEKEALDEPYLKEEWVRCNDDMVFVVPEGCYFVMGDNRNDSFDSRYWAQSALMTGLAKDEKEAASYSFVPKESIYAKAYLKYWKGFSWLD